MNKAVISIGRWQGIHLGHDKIIKILINEAKKINGYPIVFIVEGAYSSKDKNRNPLSGYMRLKIMKRIYPNVRFEVISNIVDIEDVLYIMGFKLYTLVAGSDRIERYKQFFGDIKAISVYRDENMSGIKGISGTKTREFIKNNDINGFAKIFASKDKKIVKEVFLMIGEVLNGNNN